MGVGVGTHLQNTNPPPPKRMNVSGGIPIALSSLPLGQAAEWGWRGGVGDEATLA